MCVTFFYQSDNAVCEPDSYRLVLANNRDEVWSKKTITADFWGDNQECISALDNTIGGGGTWLGMNRNGKLGVIHNVINQTDRAKKRRGSLVVNYISGTADPYEYAKNILVDMDTYKGFSMLLFDLGKQENKLTSKPVYVSNAKNYSSSVKMRTLPANTFLAISNTPMEYPFQKVEVGKVKFGQIVSQYPAVTSKAHLVENLFEFLADKRPLLPDCVMERAASSSGMSPEEVEKMSAINYFSEQTQSGTRTSTLILVDSQGHVDYIEKTYDFTDSKKPTSTTSHQTFSLEIQQSGT